MYTKAILDRIFHHSVIVDIYGATGNTRVNSCKKNMKKRNSARKIRPKRDKINPVSYEIGKALTMVGVFCFYSKLHCVNIIDNKSKASIFNTTNLTAVACFKSENEIDNLHRNNQKMSLWKPTADQQLSRVVSQCSDWW